ncbi:hypothetical protein E8E13_000476 [Curvularia kusanoi]|uniref:Uncharacterized protein n=1 Tax=Curvularia kusanoi TaxID=90978 RepID=A0A9P4T4D1_CURKU|nr:hypothetical protein E8E13_000476 [Curvularia kusanoi]
MVTTRRGTETPGMASTPASSAKKIGKRELDALETPTQVKRARKTTVEVKRTLRSTPRKGDAPPSAESTQEENSEEAEGDDDNTAGTSKTSPLAIRRRSSPQVVVEPSSPIAAKDDAPAADDGFHTPEPASSEANFVTPFTSKKALAGSPTPKASQETPAAAKKARGRPAKKTHKEDTNIPEEIPSSTHESTSTSPPAKAHVRFGSEEPTANLKGHTRYEAPAAASTAAATAQNDDDDSGSDSDEAPEMVSTSAAATKAAAAAADTSRALAAQTEKERKKREARLARIAEEQAAKRERDALKAKKAAARAAKAARLSSVAEAADEDEDDTPMLDRSALPSLLPDDLLATLGDVRPPTPPPEARGKTEEELRREKLNHHIKFLEQSSKAPKDRRVGKHHVAVLGQQSKNMAAKVSRNTKGVREAWLKGRQGQKTQGKPRLGKTHRAKFGGGGFLRGDD